MGAPDFSLALPEASFASNVAVEFEKRLCNTLWITMKKNMTSETQNFSLDLLHDFRKTIDRFEQSGVTFSSDGQPTPIHYTVLKSDHPDYFSLGGDLKYFRECIRKNDKDSLYEYSKMCLDILQDWSRVFARTTTIAFVQGRALGGGFEAALNADFIIAEEQSTFSFPEIMFGLFPCTGGMSLLARRVGVMQAERMMSNGRIYKAAELKELGVIDEVCARGDGELAVEKFILAHAKRRAAREALQRGRHRLSPLDYPEMLNVVNEWVDAAMQLGDEELGVMDMLILMQRTQKNLQPNLRLAT
jgi:DSF synthase